jgi:biotin carboxyl carrier protein
MQYIATVDGQDFTIDVDRAGEVTIDDAVHAVDLRAIGGKQLYSLILDNRSYEVFVERRAGVYHVMIRGDLFVIDVEEARLKQLKAMSGQAHVEQDAGTITAPMPGMVIKVLVEAGQAVEAGQGLMILEAMKMENQILCPRAGVVRSLGVVAGQTVNLGDLLAVVEGVVEGTAEGTAETA